MSVAKKILNVLGIIVAWLLSILLVVMLVVTPIVFSTLSLLDAKTITKAFTSVVSNMGTTGDAGATGETEDYGLVKLSNTSQDAAPAEGNDLSQAISGVVGEFVGESVPQEAINAILNSKAAQELIATYTEDLTNALTGSGKEAKFNAEKLKAIVNDNLDEIVNVIKTASPDIADADLQEIKSTIQTAVNENADKIIEALPKPEEIKQQLVQESPELEMALNILAAKDTIKLAIIGVIVVLSALIFVCRLCGFRGFRWLAVDLFVAGGIGLLPSLGLTFGASAVNDMLADNAMLSSVVGSIVSSLATGMLIRVLIMLLCGGGLLTAYIFIKKAKAKKCLKIENEQREECENVGYESAEV